MDAILTDGRERIKMNEALVRMLLRQCLKWLIHRLYYGLPIGSATLARTRRDAGQQPSTTKLLFNVCIKFPALLTLLNLPDDMVALLSFLSSTISFLLPSLNQQFK
ncbi:hypothetical protein RJ640_025373 [Escallonia rubra]|uniref:Uncharacterized protein n=1 Tax=Escallonia rubra TaxID=112253 RepID=A0AA88QQY0_9ASTE|nr:hypothetical protein RJ640_025373 [Escallonia rubra]